MHSCRQFFCTVIFLSLQFFERNRWSYKAGSGVFNIYKQDTYNPSNVVTWGSLIDWQVAFWSLSSTYTWNVTQSIFNRITGTHAKNRGSFTHPRQSHHICERLLDLFDVHWTALNLFLNSTKNGGDMDVTCKRSLKPCTHGDSEMLLF